MIRRLIAPALLAAAAASPAVAQPSPVPEAPPDDEGEAAPSPPGPADAEPAGGADADLDLDALEAEIEAALGADAAAAADVPAAPSRAGGLAALATVMNPDLAVFLDVAAAWFVGGDETGANRQTGGHDPTRNGFGLQQLELAISKAIDPYFRFDGNLVFSPFGVEIEEAYATTLALPHALQVRAGQFLTRFGRINPTHLHAWDFVDQPLAIGRVFGGEGNRGLGAELSWLTPLPWYVELVGSITDPTGEATARSFFGAEPLPLETPLDLQTTVAVKQFFELSDDWSLLAGASLATGPNATGHANRTDVWGVDLYLRWRPVTYASDQLVTVQTEWLHRRRQVPHALLADVTGYAQATWRFARRWSAGARWELGTAATGGADPLDPAWTGARQRAAAALTFHPTEFSRVRAQASLDHVEWGPDVAPSIAALFVALEVAAGAHAAHVF